MHARSLAGLTSRLMGERRAGRIGVRLPSLGKRKRKRCAYACMPGSGKATVS
uniref:Uncharacterized protein n=1 Tax=Arundo donax TaxID=35708 RepID=A0A0A9AX74_ARUDO